MARRTDPNLEAKLEALAKIYDIHRHLAADQKWACTRGCAVCCTCNVTLTTLEGIYLIRNLGALPPRLLTRLQARAQTPRYQPRLSLNDFAWRCASGRPTPEERQDPRWGRCPLLEHEVCTIYAERPFGCRSMHSLRRCAPRGQAVLSEFQLTLNHLFLQVIEHLDCPGWTGNLTDILLHLHSDGHGTPDSRAGAAFCLAANQPARVLMIPPEQRPAAAPVLKTLQQILSSFQES